MKILITIMSDDGKWGQRYHDLHTDEELEYYLKLFPMDKLLLIQQVAEKIYCACDAVIVEKQP